MENIVSLFMKKNTLYFVLISFFAVVLSTGQDFGYEYYDNLNYRSIGVNYSAQEFSPLSSNTLTDSSRIKFVSNLPFIEYRELGLRLAVGYQEYSATGQTHSSLSVYAESSNDFSLTGKAEKNGFFIPVIVSANYVNAEAVTPGAKDFEVGSLGIGTGIKYRYFSRSFGIQLSGTGAFHYSSEGFSVEYGSSLSYAGEAVATFPNLFLGGAVIGYRYQFQNWNMSDASFDYQRFYHGPFIGILF
ncbi:MAG: hypothetical protein WCT99_04590 [Bacteroidota bacterium]